MQKKFPNTNKLLLCIKQLVSEQKSKHIEHLGIRKDCLKEALEILESEESKTYNINWVRNVCNKLMYLHPTAGAVTHDSPVHYFGNCIDCPDFANFLEQAEKEIYSELEKFIKK